MILNTSQILSIFVLLGIANAALILPLYNLFILSHYVLVAILLIMDIPYRNWDLINVLHNVILFIKSIFFIYMFIMRHVNLANYFFILLIFSSILILVVICYPRYVKFLVILYYGRTFFILSSLSLIFFCVLFVIYCISVLF